MEPSRQQLFEVLAREHLKGLLAFVRSFVGDATAADDLAQDTLLEAWRSLDRYDPKHPFRAWLGGIAKNRVRAYRREVAIAGKHVASLNDDEMDVVAAKLDALARPRRGEVMTETFIALRECIAGLPIAMREAIHAAYQEQLPSRTIAQRLGATIETVKKRLQRARAALAECLNLKLAGRVADG